MSDVDDAFKGLIISLRCAINEHENAFLNAGDEVAAASRPASIESAAIFADRHKALDDLLRDLHEFNFRLQILTAKLRRG